MLGVSAMLGSSDAAAAESGSSGGGGDVAGPGPTSAGGFSEEDKLRMDESDRSSAGNRWPRQETLALIKIRTDMDVAFRDSSLKGPLWEEVSRKLAELGYHRSPKKCKEKFENVFKYHKRTKEGRAGTKSEGKTYRFFDQLEALDNQPPPPPPRPQLHQAATPATPLSVAMPADNPNSFVPPVISNSTVSSTQHISMSLAQTQIPASVSQSVTPIRGLNFTNSLPLNTFPPSSQPPTTNPISISFSTAFPPSNPTESSNPASVSSSSSTSSDEEPERRRKRKRKWADFFQRLTSEVMEKQEEMQRKFLQALEKRENDRAAREEEWRAQEIARMNREHDLLVQERSMAAAKDAAVITFLQKISDQQIPNPAQFLQQNNPPPRASPPQPIQQPPLPTPPPQPQSLPQPLPLTSTPPPPPQSVIQSPPPASKPLLQLQVQPLVLSTGKPKTDNGGENLNFSPNASSSRWPKTEVEALIKLRTNLDLKYQENVPKGPLWEEISAGMLKLGYNRNPKRCKEKWENINKYFKKVKESNKKRPEDSKTCPYFQQLDALHKEKTKNVSHFKAENQMAAPIMVQPEQQWPLQPQEQRPKQETEGHDSEDDEEDDDEDDDDEAGNYELVASKPSSLGTAE